MEKLIIHLNHKKSTVLNIQAAVDAVNAADWLSARDYINNAIAFADKLDTLPEIKQRIHGLLTGAHSKISKGVTKAKSINTPLWAAAHQVNKC